MRLFGRNSAWAFYLAVAASGAGCSVHPLPDDVSRETTISIIQRIRCEAKGELRRQVQYLFDESPSPTVKSMNPDRVIDDLETIRQYDPYVAAKIDTYKLTEIVYIFHFKITEMNNAGFSATFLRPFDGTDTRFNLPIGGGVNKQRIGERNIEIIENFEDMRGLDCNKVSASYENLPYPLTGSIGMNEVVRTFLRLGETGAGGLLKKAELERISKQIRPQFGDKFQLVDHLKFTTRVVSGIKPHIELAPVGGSFRLVDASGDFSAERKDFHELTVTMVFPITPTGDRPSAEALSKPGPELESIKVATKRKAAEELCIQRLKNREEETGVASLKAPEEYCQTERPETATADADPTAY